ncbi:unnamed protein product [Closterium sp. NIES-53]
MSKLRLFRALVPSALFLDSSAAARAAEGAAAISQSGGLIAQSSQHCADLSHCFATVTSPHRNQQDPSAEAEIAGSNDQEADSLVLSGAGDDGSRSGAERAAGSSDGRSDGDDGFRVRSEPWIFNLTELPPDSTAARLSEESKENIWLLHQKDPGHWSVARLAREYRVRQQRVHAILWLKDLEKKMEEEQGKPLDDSIAKEFEKQHGSYDKAVGERHVKIYPSEAVDSLPEGPERVKLLLQESEKEEVWKLDEFVKRMEFNKKQMADGSVKVNAMERRRPPNGWTYLVEELGEAGRRGRGGGYRFVVEPGKHVVITGGSSGIGLACAKQYYREGASVTLIARNHKKLVQARKEVEACLDNIASPSSNTRATLISHNPWVSIKSVDATDPAAIKAAITSIDEECPIDVLQCNAGIVRTGFVEDISAEDVQSQVHTNFLGSVYPVQAVLPSMKARAEAGEEPGAIVFTCSLAALSFWYGASIYTATKYAVRGFAEALRLELLPYNIQVSLICPGFTDTALLDDAEFTGKHLTRSMKIACFYDRNNVETPDSIAQCTIATVRSGEFLVVTTHGIVPRTLCSLSRGIFPSNNIFMWLFEIIWAFGSRIVSLLVRVLIFSGLRAIHRQQQQEQRQHEKGSQQPAGKKRSAAVS